MGGHVRRNTQDPIDFQLALLLDDELAPHQQSVAPSTRRRARHRRVLEKLRELVQLGGKPLLGKGRGVAVQDIGYCPEYAGAVGTVMVEVAEDDRCIKVGRVVVVLEAGRIVNPDNAIAQVEGSIAFGLSDFLYSKITLENGRVSQSDYHDYRVIKMAGMPAVEVHFLPSQEHPQGIAELSVALVIAAAADALADISRQPVRSLPVAAEGVLSRDDIGSTQ